MAHDSYVLPIVNSSSPESFARAEEALRHPTHEAVVLNLRVALSTTAFYYNDSKSSWAYGLRSIDGVELTDLKASDSQVAKEITGSPTTNKGFWIPFNPVKVLHRTLQSPNRIPNYYRANPRRGEHTGFGIRNYRKREFDNRLITGFTHLLHAWEFEGTAMLSEQEFALKGLVKAGRGGGIVYITPSTSAENTTSTKPPVLDT